VVAFVTRQASNPMGGFPKAPLAKAATTVLCQIPWETFLGGSAAIGGAAIAKSTTSSKLSKSVSAPPKPKDKPKPKTTKSNSHQGPGCNAADNSLQALGYLTGLARGNQGFGVLAIGKTKLEEGANSCDSIGHPKLANGLRSVANGFPEIKDKKGARQAAVVLMPLVDEAWELGRTCKGSTDRVEKILKGRKNGI